MIEFTPYPKTARLFKDGLSMVVTEKIDGTNAAVCVAEGWDHPHKVGYANPVEVSHGDGTCTRYLVYAQSRNRLIAPAIQTGEKGSDNYGFAQWTWENAEALARTLGEGFHFGEWWGQGIGRNYGLTEKRFSLFNTGRWSHLNSAEARLSLGVPGQLSLVPLLGVGPLDSEVVMQHMRLLEGFGSYAVPGFMKPEGICVYVPVARQTFKVTFDGDKPKWELEALKAAV